MNHMTSVPATMEMHRLQKMVNLGDIWLFSWCPCSVTRCPQCHLIAGKAVSSHMWVSSPFTSCCELKALGLIPPRRERCSRWSYTTSALLQRLSSLGWQFPFCCTLFSSSVLGGSFSSVSWLTLESASLLCSFYNKHQAHVHYLAQ